MDLRSSVLNRGSERTVFDIYAFTPKLESAKLCVVTECHIVTRFTVSIVNGFERAGATPYDQPADRRARGG
jgi:hypothetical protein